MDRREERPTIEFSTRKTTIKQDWLGSKCKLSSISTSPILLRSSTASSFFREDGSFARYRDPDEEKHARPDYDSDSVRNFDKVIDVFACLDETRQV